MLFSNKHKHLHEEYEKKNNAVITYSTHGLTHSNVAFISFIFVEERKIVPLSHTEENRYPNSHCTYSNMAGAPVRPAHLCCCGDRSNLKVMEDV